MNEVNNLHDEAMRLAEMAEVAKLRGEFDNSDQYLAAAYDNEAKAAYLMINEAAEPTRSVLFRSAASLAIDCKKFREAEKLIAFGFTGEPPKEIADELLDLLEMVNFQRHLDLHGLALDNDELQMSLFGDLVSFGVVRSEQLITRIEDARKLVYRTVERLLKRPYREAGAATGAIKEYGLFVSVPRAASFAVSLKVAHPKQVLPGFEVEAQIIPSAVIIDEIMDCLDTFNRSEQKKLQEKIPEPAYYRNFVGIAKNLAPDGKDISQVGFTSQNKGQEKRVSLTKTRDRLKMVGEVKKPTPSGSSNLVTITGKLLFADERRVQQSTIQIMDDKSICHNIIVPIGMMSDIVKPLWEERVTVMGYSERRGIRLEDISRASPENDILNPSE